MKRTYLHFFVILLVVTMACISANAEPMVFSVTHTIRDIGLDLTAKAIRQETGIQTVPEPSTFILLGSAVTGLLGFHARRKNRKQD